MAIVDENFASLKPSPLNWKWRNAPNVNEAMLDFGYYTRIEMGADPLCAMVTVDLYDKFDAGSGYWLHISVTRQRKMPNWNDLVVAREELGYKDFVFIQLLPPTKYWINVHNYCLHVFSRLDAETVPRILWDQEGATGENYQKQAFVPK